MNGAVVLLVVAIIIGVAFFIWSSRSNYSHNHPVLKQVRANFALLNPAYAKIPLREGGSAYTENKASITLCIMNPKTKRPYDMNTIMYVALHELAHMVSKTTGHNDEFRNNFKTLLFQGAKKGIYDPRVPIPSTYCGVGPND